MIIKLGTNNKYCLYPCMNYRYCPPEQKWLSIKEGCGKKPLNIPNPGDVFGEGGVPQTVVEFTVGGDHFAFKQGGQSGVNGVVNCASGPVRNSESRFNQRH